MNVQLTGSIGTQRRIAIHDFRSRPHINYTQQCSLSSQAKHSAVDRLDKHYADLTSMASKKAITWTISGPSMYANHVDLE